MVPRGRGELIKYYKGPCDKVLGGKYTILKGGVQLRCGDLSPPKLSVSDGRTIEEEETTINQSTMVANPLPLNIAPPCILG